MPSVIACPDVELLKKIALGDPALPDGDSLIEHIARCSVCATRLNSIAADDPIVEAVRSKEATPRPEQEAVRRLLAKVRGLVEETHSQQIGATVDLPPESSAAPGTSGTAAFSWDDSAPVEEKEDDGLAAPHAADELGRLGPYRILKVLGEGGMGKVFLAEDPVLQRQVALKVMKKSLARNLNARKRFLQEARTAAKIEHDNIIHIYQVGEDHGVPFLAMPLLKGASLEDLLRRSAPLQLKQTLRIGIQIAEGLAAAHASNLIHRDIKPANIWIEPTGGGRVKILDFGLARTTEGEVGLTQSGTILGTPAYMPPEQARGEKVDARADLYSLGCVLYRMTTGSMPHKGHDTMSILMALATQEPAAPSLVKPAVPKPLSDLTMKLLAKDPAQRVGSAKEVVQALKAIERADASAVKSDTAIVSAASAHVPIAQIVSKPVRPAEKPNPFAFDAVRAEQKANTPVKPVEAPTASLAPPKRRRPVALFALAAACMLFGAGSVIFYWQTNNGTVKIEINDPKIQVTFNQKTLIFKGVDDKQNLRVTPGQYGLHVERDGLEFDTDKPIVIKRGEVVALKIEWLKDGKLQVVRGDKVIGAKSVRADVTPISLPARPQPAYALLYNGDASVAGNSLVIPQNGNLTLEAYVDQSVEINGVDQAILVGTPFCISIFARGEKWNFIAHQKSASITTNIQAPMQKNRRTHIAGVRDGKTLRLFVDGKKVAEKEMQQDDLKKVQRDFMIGEKGFSGQLGEVRVSKVARYDKNFTPQKRFEPDADTLALYHFDEGSGDVLKDSSGNGHHGKIVGAKWVQADGTPPPGRSPYDAIDPAKLVVGPDLLWRPKELIAVAGAQRFDSWRRPVRDVQLSKDGKTLFASSQDGTITIRAADSGRVRQLFEHQVFRDYLSAQFAVSPDERWLVYQKTDKDMIVWDLKENREVKTLPAAQRLAFSPDGKSLLALAFPILSVIDPAADWKVKKEIAVGKQVGNVLSLALSRDSKRAALTITDNNTGSRVRAFDIGSGDTVCDWQIEPRVRLGAFGLNSDELLFGSFFEGVHTIGRLDLKTGKVDPQKVLNGAMGLALSPDGKQLLVSRIADFLAIRPDDLSQIWSKSLNQVFGVSGISISGDGQRVALGDDTGSFALHDASTGNPIGMPLPRHVQYYRTFALPDGRVLLSGTDIDSRLLDFATGKEVSIPKIKGIDSAIPTPDGRQLIMALAKEKRVAVVDWQSGGVRNLKVGLEVVNAAPMDAGRKLLLQTKDSLAIADFQTGVLEKQIPTPGQIRLMFDTGLAVDPPGRRAALIRKDGKDGRYGHLLLFDLHSGKLERSFPLANPVLLAHSVFSRDGQWLALGHSDRTGGSGPVPAGLRLWAAATGAERKLAMPKGLRPGIAVDISSDGTELANGGYDGRIHFWDIASGNYRRSIRVGPANGVIWNVAYAPDGRHLVVNTAAGFVLLLRLESVPLVNAAPGPWQPLLDANLTNWNKNGANEPNILTVLESEKEPVLRMYQDSSKEIAVTTKKPYQNHHLRLEFRTPLGKKSSGFSAGFIVPDGGGRTGVGFIVHSDGKVRFSTWGAKGTPALLDNGVIVPSEKSQFMDASLNAAGVWNQFDLVRLDDRLLCFVNGRFIRALAGMRQVRDEMESEIGKALISMHSQTGEVEFRRIEVRDINALPPELLAPGPWQPLLDAKLSKWNKGNNLSDGIVVTEIDNELALQMRREAGKDGRYVSLTNYVQNHHLRLDFQFTGKEPGLLFVGHTWGQWGKFLTQFQIASNGTSRRAVQNVSISEAVLERGALASTGVPGKINVRIADAILEPAGAWNRLDLVRVEDRVACFVNGRFLGAFADLRELTDGKATAPGKISITLLCSKDEVRFRRISIREINSLPPELLVRAPFPPLDPAWLQAVAAMKPEQQIEAVKTELMKRNPGFNGTWKPLINQAGVVSDVELSADNVADLSPLRAFAGLAVLGCSGSHDSGGPQGKIADLSALKGMRLTRLTIANNKLLSDLTPLRDMSLTHLIVYHTSVVDLAPLKDMKLALLDCAYTRVADLAPIIGMPLTTLIIDGMDLADLSLLKDLPLTQFSCSGTHVGGPNGKITSLAPLRGMKLTHLRIANQPKISDLGPLKGMPLTQLIIFHTPVSDLSPLAGMKITELNCGYTRVADLSHLKGMPLKALWCDFNAERDAAVLRSITTLETINGKDTKEFWKEAEGKKLNKMP